MTTSTTTTSLKDDGVMDCSFVDNHVSFYKEARNLKNFHGHDLSRRVYKAMNRNIRLFVLFYKSHKDDFDVEQRKIILENVNSTKVFYAMKYRNKEVLERNKANFEGESDEASGC